MYKIIQKRNIFFIFSGFLLIPGILALIFWGLPLGIDFKGGSSIELEFINNRPSISDLQNKLATLNLGNIVIQPTAEKGLTLKLKHIDNDTHQKILDTIKSNFGDFNEASFQTIGPTIGKELKQKSIVATILVLIFIILYITFAYRKVSSGPVRSWVYGVSAVIALIHDVFMLLGIFAILSHFLNIEIDTLFVTALLTVLGFSVHDTIVVFDRIRERLKLSYNKTFQDTVNESVNQTLARSINTSMTTIIVLLAMFLFGGQSIRYFILALIIGITTGTYSSIFIASPLLVVWNNWRSKSLRT